jgi:hypothetical protein
MNYLVNLIKPNIFIMNKLNSQLISLFGFTPSYQSKKPVKLDDGPDPPDPGDPPVPK